MYANSRNSRDAPNVFSGDETITRVYTRKATDIRMRTSKKNESGILNQNLCSSNEGYATYKEGDPKCCGFTFANMAYPGASYNYGSMFREKDMGNLLQLIFMCDKYFRFKDLELVTDSHFGHIVPLVFSRLWKVYVTSSFSAGQRIGISGIETLSRKELEKSDRDELVNSLKDNLQELDEKKDALDSSDDDVEDYCIKKPKKTFRALKTRLHFFEKKLSIRDKGNYEVWRADISPLPNCKIPIFLHAVNDSKPVYRISNKYAVLPRVEMNMTEFDPDVGKKVSVVKQTSEAHKTFRLKMGFNDGSDRMRQMIGLSGRYYRSWPKHIVAKTLEDAIINAYGNYLLDPSCPVEPFTTFLYQVVQEFLDSGKNLRQKSVNQGSYKRSYMQRLKRPRPGSDAALQRGAKCRGGRDIGSFRIVDPKDRTKKCAFCGRQKAMWMCRSCNAHLCIARPKPTKFGKQFPLNGPTCYQRYHGMNVFPRG